MRLTRVKASLKRIFTLKRIIIAASTKAVVLSIVLSAVRVHFISELLAAEAFFALLFAAFLVIVASVYLIGGAAEAIEKHFVATLRSHDPDGLTFSAALRRRHSARASSS